MSSGLGADIKERVRQATDIVELVGSYLQLRRAGRNDVALCPWHDDARPSLQINPDRQSFKCWVCNIGGDVFSFVMQREGVDFREALQLLAEKAGIPLHDSLRAQPGSPNDKHTLLQALAWAEQQFHEFLLRDEAGESARKYVEDRGLTAESVRKFRLGASPTDWAWLLNRARGTSFSPAVLEQAGLILPRQSGQGFYDRFRGRLIFPIRNPQGQAVAFGARVLPERAAEERAKYINSPETPLFSKSRMLYGLDQAGDSLRREKTALVMEGYTDVIAAHQAGVSTALAVLGTALGEAHVQLLKRYVERVVLVLDGDEAGQKRTNEVLGLFISQQVDLRVLTLPDGLDPCDFLLAQGAAPFLEMADGAVDALEHKFRLETQGLDFRSDDTHHVNRVVESVLGALAQAPKPSQAQSSGALIREQHLLQRLSHKVGLSEQMLRQRLAEMRRGESAVRKPTMPGSELSSAPEPPIMPWERELLELLLHWSHGCDDVFACISAEDLNSAACRRLYAKACELRAGGSPVTYERLALEFHEPRVQYLLVELVEGGAKKAENRPEAALARWRDDLLAAFRRRQVEARRRWPGAVQQDGAGDSQPLDQFLANLEQERQRHGIKP